LNRWLIHRLEQLRIHYPDEMLAWFREHTEAVHSGDLEKVEDELIDLAVACLIGISSIESNGMQW